MVVLLKEEFQFTWDYVLLSAAGLNALVCLISYAILKEPLKSEPLLNSEEESGHGLSKVSSAPHLHSQGSR